MAIRVFLFCLQWLLLIAVGVHSSCDFTPRDGLYVLCASQAKIVEISQNTSLGLYTKPTLNNSVYLEVHVEGSHIIEAPEDVLLDGENETKLIVRGKRAGIATISFYYNDTNDTIFYKLNKVERDISIIHAKWIDIFSLVVGWMYFFAWSISFYPQIIENCWRRSVVGLNFDFLAFNITGFIAYGVYNVGLYWIPRVQEEYRLLHPGGVNPVQLNDVIFTLHAIAACAFLIFQCFIFERGSQRVSVIGGVLLAMMWLTIIISLFVAVGGKISWFIFLLISSYVKLAVTLIKYIPQAVMNCRRRSTVGWSIGNVLLDVIGGALSILQMFLISYNYNDWQSIFGDPTKFGLGALSIAFDALFIIQHYVLFRGRQPQEVKPWACLDFSWVHRWTSRKKYVGVDREDDDLDQSNEKTPMINTSNKKGGRQPFRTLFNFCSS